MLIFFLIIISFVFYLIVFRSTDSIFVKPNLFKMVFFRDYLILTMIPYCYYLYGNRYQDHYILGQLNDGSYFYIAAIFAFVFMFFFLLTCRFFELPMNVLTKKVSYKIVYSRAIYTVNFLTLMMLFYFIFVSVKFDGGVIGLMKYPTSTLEVMRAKYTQGGGFFSLNKIILKSWLPMLSYLSFYLYLKNPLKYKRVDKFILKIALSLGLLSSVWFFEKSVVFFYLLGLVSIYVYSGRRLNKKFSMIIPFAALGLVSLMYILVNQDKIQDSNYLLDILLHRTSSQATGSVMAVHYFDSHDFLYLSGISNSLAALVGENFQSPYSLLIDFYVPEYAETSGALSSFAVGEAYALFGLIGVFLSGIIVGLYYSFFEATKHSNFLSVIFVGVYGLFFSHFYVASSFYGFLWPVGLAYQTIPFFIIAIIICDFKRDFNPSNI